MASSLEQTALRNPVVLISIDGWGLSDNSHGNAIFAAQTPHMQALERSSDTTLFTKIEASGFSVGLPKGVMGNSEVGHLTMGAGRAQFQDLVRINKAKEDGEFKTNEKLVEAFTRAKNGNGRLQMLGLVSDGGVHSHQEHLYALLEAAKFHGVANTYVHFFADGRDTKPSSAVGYIEQLLAVMKKLDYGKISTIIGRYYAMDRDKRWDRIELAYNALLNGEGEVVSPSALLDAVQAKYAAGETDEFLKPMIIDSNGTVQDNDTLIFFDYRSDRMREIVESIGIKPPFPTKLTRNGLAVYQFTQYSENFSLPIIFPPQSMKNVLAEWLSLKRIHQFHTAETEKYAHVTFFFNGGREEQFPLEERRLIPSPKVATYDLKPEMSQREVGESVIEAIKSGKYSFIMCNLAAPDMVGHTGVFEKAVIACTVCDEVIGSVLAACQKYGYLLVVTSDHGNVEEMLDDKGNPKTSHTTNLVPLCIAANPRSGIVFEDSVLAANKANAAAGGLSNVAPTILTLMGLPIPSEMTGKSLVKYA